MIDSFIRDRLPPPDRQPEFLFTLPELHYPERLNAAVELIGKNFPAMAVIGVSALVEPRAKIEIETLAVVPE
jgi:enamine deaminase RidA (YjgF/YER057c/UK114 family)